MKLYSLFLIKFIFFFLFTSCAYFDEEEDKILPGKRERVFISDDKILKKANKRVKILPPKTSNSFEGSIFTFIFLQKSFSFFSFFEINIKEHNFLKGGKPDSFREFSSSKKKPIRLD